MTRRLALDFRPRRRAGSWIGASILIVGVIAAVAAAEHYKALEDRRAALEAGLRERARAKPAGQRAEAGASRDALQRRQNARRAVVRALGRPWDALYGDIETASVDDVALLAVEPDPRRGDVRIAGEARDAQALHGYVAVLESTPSLGRVSLAQHETVGAGAPGALRFVLVARWQSVRN
jgi:hypothetical protein